MNKKLLLTLVGSLMLLGSCFSTGPGDPGGSTAADRGSSVAVVVSDQEEPTAGLE